MPGKGFRAVTSKAQSRALFAKARLGEISLEEARGKTAAANWAKLPEQIMRKKKRR